MSNIRVGMIRCDCHTLYYACIMGEHDPYLLRMPVPREQIMKVHRGSTWKRGGVFKYFYTLFGNPEKMTVEQVPGFEVVRLWDANRSDAEIIQRIMLGRPQVCETLDEVTEDVDLVFISDCNFDGSDHLELARPGLLKGLPTFVDKPFAFTTADALQMLRIAEEHGAPIMSLSILRMLPTAHRFARRMEEIGEIQFSSIQGGGGSMAGIVHTVALAQKLFGPGIEKVRCMADEAPTNTRLHYREGSGGPPCGVVITGDTGGTPDCAMYASIFGTEGDIHSGPLDDWQFTDGAVEITRAVKRMVEEGKSPMPDDQMIEIVAAIEAARQSMRDGSRPVMVRDVIERARTEAREQTQKRAAVGALEPVIMPDEFEREAEPVRFVQAG